VVSSVIEQLPAAGAGVLGVKVSGMLRHEDFSELLALVDSAVARQDRCRLLILFGDFHGWDPHALLDDLKFHTSECAQVERIAYVGDTPLEAALVNLSRPFTNSVVRYFDIVSLDAAKEWLEAT